MKLLAGFICCLLIFDAAVCEVEFDYYWREYTGVIPDDAVPGGLDINGKTTYIAQLYVNNNGLLPTRIYPGERKVTASRDGIHTSELFAKILCSQHKGKFIWYPVTAKDLHTQTANKHLVVGGTENGRILNIGRVQYQGELIVGKSCSYSIGNGLLFFPYKNKEINFNSYEVLVYEKNAVENFDVRFKS